jgi:hypothetical protein
MKMLSIHTKTQSHKEEVSSLPPASQASPPAKQSEAARSFIPVLARGEYWSIGMME